MDYKDIIFCILNSLLSIYISCLFFETFSQKSSLRFKKLFLCTIFLIFTVTLIFLKNNIFSFTILIFIVYALSYFYNIKWYNRIFLSILITLIFSFAELIVALISSSIFKLSLSALKTGYYFVAGMLLSKLLVFVIISIIKIGKHKLPAMKIGFLWIYIIILPITSFVLIFIMVDYIYRIENNSFMLIITILGFVLLILSNIFIFYVIDKICDQFATERKLMIANELIENQKKTYRDLIDSQTKIRKIKHDLKNVMIGILHDLNNNKISDAINHLQKNCDYLNNDENILVSGNSIIDTIISVKNEVAKNLGIHINIEIELLNQINIDPIDFSVLLGNIIDNAIEATEKTSTQEKTIDASIYTKNSSMVLTVINPIDNKIDINNLVTTKKDKDMHGFGILQIKSLANKYNGNVFFECTDSKFKVTVFINNKLYE